MSIRFKIPKGNFETLCYGQIKSKNAFLHSNITQEDNDCSCLGGVYEKAVTLWP